MLLHQVWERGELIRHTLGHLQNCTVLHLAIAALQVAQQASTCSSRPFWEGPDILLAPSSASEPHSTLYPYLFYVYARITNYLLEHSQPVTVSHEIWLQPLPGAPCVATPGPSQDAHLCMHSSPTFAVFTLTLAHGLQGGSPPIAQPEIGTWVWFCRHHGGGTLSCTFTCLICLRLHSPPAQQLSPGRSTLAGLPTPSCSALSTCKCNPSTALHEPRGASGARVGGTRPHADRTAALGPPGRPGPHRLCPSPRCPSSPISEPRWGLSYASSHLACWAGTVFILDGDFLFSPTESS